MLLPSVLISGLIRHCDSLLSALFLVSGQIGNNALAHQHRGKLPIPAVLLLGWVNKKREECWNGEEKKAESIICVCNVQCLYFISLVSRWEANDLQHKKE